MPETVEFLEGERVIRVRSFGQTTIEDWRASLGEVLGLIRETGVKRVLVDVREQRTAPDLLEIYTFASELPIEIRFAVVISPVTEDSQLFLETVARNRARWLRAFRGLDEAVGWLRTGEVGPAG